MLSADEYKVRLNDLLFRFEAYTCSKDSWPILAFIERHKATRALEAKVWMEVTKLDVIEYAKANWKPHRAQADLVTCDPNDASRVDVICVILPQV